MKLFKSDSAKRKKTGGKPEGIDHWDEVGRAQFDYLCKEGLQPHHYMLDVPCGSFRAGRFFIDYLSEGHYFGADREQKHIDIGIDQVLTSQGLLAKRPDIRTLEFTADAKDLAKLFGRRFDFIWVHALFDHIPHDVIRYCLRDLSAILEPGARLYATIFLNPHGPQFLEPMVRPRNGSLERAVVTFPDREFWHHTLDFFEQAVRECPGLKLDACLYDYPHPLGLRMLRFVKQ